MVQRILLAIFTFAVPVLPGALYISKGRKISIPVLLECYVAGQIGLWGVFQLICVLFVQLKWSFSLMYYVFISMVVIASICGLIRLIKHPWKIRIPGIRSIVIWGILLLAIAIILNQMGIYIYGMHVDDDDAKWIVEANDAITYDSMFLINPSNGEPTETFVGDMIRDSFSPWPMFIACLSMFTGIRPVIMAHTVYAPVLVAFSYLVYLRMGDKLFKGLEEKIIFVFLVAVLTSFFSGNGNTGADFLLIRIWQGKAVVAGIMIPAIFSQYLAIQRDDTIQNWLMLFFMSCACSLMSGMGIVIAIIMTGAFGLYFLLFKKWRRIPLWILTLLPSITLEIMYQSVL